MKKLFINGNIVDVVNGCVIRKSFEVIDDIITSFDISTEDHEVIDLEGLYVLPGLIDCHTHIFFSAEPDLVAHVQKSNHTDLVLLAEENLQKHLKSGVTLIRDVGGIDYLDVQIKKHVENGRIIGPDLLVSGKLITMTGGHGHFAGREADGIDEVRKATREQLKAGVDVVKIMASGGVLTPGVDVNSYQLNVDELKAAAEEAHKAGKTICTHCHSTEGIKNAVHAGIDSIEHGTLLDLEGALLMQYNNTYLVPTFSALVNILSHKKEIPQYAYNKANDVFSKHKASFELALNHHIRVAMGTDAGTPFNQHGDSPKELLFMKENGMSTINVLKAATINGAELLKMDHLHGSIEINKKANFLLLKENPIEVLSTVLEPTEIYKNGRKINL